MATLNFATTDKKVFTPISSALANLPNGAGTMIVLTQKTVTGATDFCGMTDSATSNWYHTLAQNSGDFLWDDDGVASATSGVSNADGLTNWWLHAVDWAAGAAATSNFHWRNQTAAGSWTHAVSGGNNGGAHAGPGTSGWMRIGYSGDENVGSKNLAFVAVWAGTRFSNSDYGLWSKTSDLYSHALGAPTFLVQCNATTLVDLIGGSTYSSANSTGSALTGGNPDNWTFDGIGTVTASPAPRTFNAIPFIGGGL